MIKKSIIKMAAMGSIFLITACGSASDRGICQEAVKSNLINPETAKFPDFSKASFDQYKNGIVARLLEGQNYGENVAGVMEDAARRMVDEEMGKLHSENNRYYALRVRAEGRLGNTITSNYVCVVKDGSCECFDTP